MANMAREDQFTLGSLIVATAFAALACATIRYRFLAPTPFMQLVAWFAVPVFLFCAIGVIRRRWLRWWLAQGVILGLSYFAALLILTAIGMRVL